MTRRSPSRWALAGEGGRAGRRARSRRGASRRVSCQVGRSHGTAACHAMPYADRPGQSGRLDHHQEDDHDDQQPEEHPAALDLLDRRQDLRRRRSGRRARGRRRRGQLDQVMQGVALDRERVGERDEVQDDAGDQPRLLLRLDLAGAMMSRTPGDALEDRQRVDQLVADGLDLARAEVRVLRLLAGHRPHDRVGEGRPERDDRPHDVQEQEERGELDEIHGVLLLTVRSTADDRRRHRCDRIGRYDTRFVRRLTKSTRTYSPRCSGVA